MPDAAEAGRAARAHGDAVHRQLAVLGDERRRQVLDADARSAGHDDDVRVGMQRVEDRLPARRARDPGKSTTPPSRSTSAASIGPLASAMWKPCGREPAGSSSLPVMTSRTRGRRTTLTCPWPTELRTPRSCGRSMRPRLEQRRAADDVFAAPADVLARRDRRQRARCDVAGCGLHRHFGRQHGVGARRHRRAGHDAHGLAWLDGAVERAAGQRVADDGQRQAAVGSRAFRAVGHDRVAVHRRAIESRHVHVADDRARQHAARGDAAAARLSAPAAAAARRARRAPRPPCGAARTRACGRPALTCRGPCQVRPLLL